MESNPIELILPALTSQAGILFDAQASTLAGSYVQQLVCPLWHGLDLELFKGAWARTIAAHPGLRAAFPTRSNGEYVQVIFQTAEMPWTTEDRDEAGKEWLDAWLARDRLRGFDLRRTPLMRAHVVFLSNGGCLFFWTVHHVLVDGWSAEIVLENVFAEYRRLRSESAEFARPGSYTLCDFERVVLEAARDESPGAAEYWTSLLESIDISPQLTPAGGGSFAGRKEIEFAIDMGIWKQFRDKCRKNGVSANVGLQALWSLTLARFSGRTSCCYGLSVSGRRQGEAEGRVVGMFVTTIPVFHHFDGDLGFTDLTKAIAKQNAASARYPRFGLSDIKRLLKLPPLGELFDSVLVFEDFLTDVQSELRQRDEERFYGQTNFPLTIVLRNTDRPIIRLMWNVALFEFKMIEGVAREFLELMDLVRNSDCTIEEIMRARGNQTPDLFRNRSVIITPPQFDSIASCLADVVATHSERPAISGADISLSYGELGQIVRQRAASLRLVGVVRGDVVALVYDRRLDAIVSMLAVNWLGATYLPLDLRDSASRLEHMLRDSSVSLILCETATAPIAEPFGRTFVTSLAQPAGKEVPEVAEHAQRAPNSAAYVMYTSGSTGTPKGVIVPDAAVLRLTRKPNFVSLGPNEVIGQHGNLTFDASTFEIFGALLTGAELVLLDISKCLEVGGLGREIRERDVTTLFVTTALLNETAMSDPAAFGTLRQLLFGGERVNAKAVDTILGSSSPPAAVIHVYGPTEGTVFTLFQLVNLSRPDSADVALGAPVSATCVRVVDGFGGDTPRGGTGEIIIGGLGLAAGYTSAERTEERFRTLPGIDGNARWYKTGDIVRRSTDDDLFFLGRDDNQVKVRGHRVELVEVEVAIERLPGVSGCVVIYDHEHSKLCAAITGSDGGLTRSTIAGAIASLLPNYMRPSEIMVLTKLPLTRNGKKDRKSVERLWKAKKAKVTANAEPMRITTRTETMLLSIWEGILGHSLDKDQNFFDSGANSLLMIRAANRIRIEVLSTLKVSDLFEYTNVADLAAFIDGHNRQ